MKDFLFNAFGLFDPGAWIFVTFVLFFIGFILFIITIVINIKKGKSLLKYIIPMYVISALFMWNIVPAIFDFCSLLYSENKEKSVTFGNIATKTAIIPWQKGSYYFRLSQTYLIYQEGKKALETLDKSLKYFKEPKYMHPMSYLTYLCYQEYDKALKIAQGRNMYDAAAKVYLIKKDYNNALIYLNKSIEKRVIRHKLSYISYDYAMRGFVYKKLGNFKEAEKEYKTAISLAKTGRKKGKVNELYNDPVSSEIQRHKKLRIEHGLD